MAVPRKVKASLVKLGIRGVVGGYSSMYERHHGPRHVRVATYTCWDTAGKVVCVMEKLPGSKEWTPMPSS